MTISQGITSTVKTSADIVKNYEAYAEGLKKIINSLVARFNIDDSIKKFIQRCSEKAYFVRTIASEKKVLLSDIFVSSNFEISSKVYSEIDIIEISKNNRLLIIEGTAGCGKSTHAKHIYTELLKSSNNDFIPLFIEFRELENIKLGILQSIIHHISQVTATEISNPFNSKSKKYIIILDGLDEILSQDKNFIRKSISSTIKSHKNINYIITTRPDIDDKHIFACDSIRSNIVPLTKEQSIAMIQKSTFPKHTIDKFLLEFNSAYENHKHLFESPLLITLFLLTYSKTAEIPKKQVVFYELAYNAFSCLHDASKECFSRSLYSGLDIMTFRSVFSATSFMSLSENRTAFLKTGILDYIKYALQYTDTHCSPEDFLHDATESIPLIIYDAPYYSYVHKSFQEYFSALFATSYTGDDRGEFIRQCCGDSILSFNKMAATFINDISPEDFNRHVVIHKINEILNCRPEHRPSDIDILHEIYTDVAAFKADDNNNLRIKYLTCGKNSIIANILRIKNIKLIDIITKITNETDHDVIKRIHFSQQEHFKKTDYTPPYEEDVYIEIRFKNPLSSEEEQLAQRIASSITQEISNTLCLLDQSTTKRKNIISKFKK